MLTEAEKDELVKAAEWVTADELIRHVDSLITAAEHAAIERCAKEIEPKNDPSDWTEHAHDSARHAARIRALSSQPAPVTRPTAKGEA